MQPAACCMTGALQPLRGLPSLARERARICSRGRERPSQQSARVRVPQTPILYPHLALGGRRPGEPTAPHRRHADAQPVAGGAAGAGRRRAARAAGRLARRRLRALLLPGAAAAVSARQAGVPTRPAAPMQQPWVLVWVPGVGASMHLSHQWPMTSGRVRASTGPGPLHAQPRRLDRRERHQMQQLLWLAS